MTHIIASFLAFMFF
ncbi:hypothetical protein [Escherichia coli]